MKLKVFWTCTDWNSLNVEIVSTLIFSGDHKSTPGPLIGNRSSGQQANSFSSLTKKLENNPTLQVVVVLLKADV